MPIVGGSHDPLLEWALRESGSGLASLPEGSEAGLARFADGSIAACAIHLHMLNHRGDPNIEALQRQGALSDALLVAFAKREQGFLVAAGNPLAIASLDDVIARGARMAVWPKGAGAQLLLISLLDKLGTSFRADRSPLAAMRDGSGHCPGNSCRPRRLWYRYAFCCECSRTRLRADHLGAVRSGDPPPRLFSSAAAGTLEFPANVALCEESGGIGRV
jgi:hypothetical protein